jgi:hypothetical protein
MKGIDDELKRKKAIITFTVAVVIVSWVPVIVQNPQSTDYISPGVFDDPQRLFLPVEGFKVGQINRTGGGYEAVYLDEEPIYVSVARVKKDGRTPEEYYAAQGFSVERNEALAIGQVNAAYLEVEKDGQIKKVIYWYYWVGESKQFFLFYAQGKNMEVVLFRIEAPDHVSTSDMVRISESIINIRNIR